MKWHRQLFIVEHLDGPPDSPWGLFQPTRPEETEKIAVKEEQ